VTLREGSPSNKCVKKGDPSFKIVFTAISLSNVKTVADKHIHAAIITKTGDDLFKGIHIDDLERP